MHNPARRLPGEGLFSLLLLTVSLFLFYTATQISGLEGLSAPGTFPMFATAMMSITAALITWRTLRLPLTDEHGWRAVLPGFVIFMTILMGFYAFALKPVGFLPTSFVFLTISTRIMTRGSLAHAMLVSALSLAVVYVVFRLIFTVLMPEGILPEREIIAYVSGIFAGGGE